MTECLESINIGRCIWFEGEDRRNAISSIIAGVLFFIGWWFIIDVQSTLSEHDHFSKAYHCCGVFGTLSLFMINSVSNAQVRGDAYSGGCLGPRGARVWLFLGFVMGFASLIASCWILFADYVAGSKPATPPHVPSSAWPGVGLFLQNAFIFTGSLVFKFGRAEDHWN